jgi:hypothetical protein
VNAETPVPGLRGDLRELLPAHVVFRTVRRMTLSVRAYTWRAAAEFVEHVVDMKCGTEVGLALKKRIKKNKDKLFTFLNYDGVPWNNNNAEHAVRAFTRLRNAINTSTSKGTREFATLLSIRQTLRYRGTGFLQFMRSGRMEIDS